MPKALLTDKLVRSLSTTLDREEFWDTALAGFGIRVTHSGGKSFFFRYRMGGRDSEKVRITLGLFPEISLAEARQRAREQTSKVVLGADPRKEAAPKKASPEEEGLRVCDFVAQFLDRSPKRGSRYWMEQKRAFEKDVLPVWGDRRADSIRKRDVSDLLESIHRRGAPIQANRTRAYLSRLFNYGIAKDLVILNPVVGTEKLGEERGRERVLSPAEVRRAWSAFEELDPSLSLHLKFKLFTLQRGSEVSLMERSHVVDGWWTIPRELTKTKVREQRVFLVPSALAILAKALEVCAGPRLFFPSGRNARLPVDIGSPAQACRRLCTRHGLEPFTPHDLRRTGSTLLAQLGVDELLISRILSHTVEGSERRVPTVTGVYNRYRYDEQKREAMLLWEKRLLEILANE